MTLSPKHLSLSEMWQLYKYIQKGLPQIQKEALIDEVIEILKGIDHDDFVSSLKLFYGNNFMDNRNAAEYGLMFIRGIKKNGFFLFTEFIESLRK